MVFLPLAAAAGGAWWYFSSERFVSTDDAYVQADIVKVSADVSGRVVAVSVHDNEHVSIGQILFRLDDRPYRIAVLRAQAQLASARLQVQAQRAEYGQDVADLQAARDSLDYRLRELSRREKLYASRIGSRASLDAARNAVQNVKQQVAAEQQQIAAVLAKLSGNPDLPTDRQPPVMVAQAQLDQAELDLSRTVVTAPADGIVTNVNRLPVGDYLTAGTPGFSLVEADKIWIEANFKETQLTHMRTGQAATVTVDSYPGTTLAARVASETPATGGEFSLLPPQNATGNWIKVVQRFPVRMNIVQQKVQRPLLPGMSVTATVDTRYESPVIARIDRLVG